MSADTTDPDGIVETKHTHDGYLVDEVDLVDLSDLSLDDNDTWLYMPPQCSSESAIHDLHAWLKTEPELDIQNNKKYIDTRTFTRPKKRSVRMSFESIFEGLPPSPTTNTKIQNTDVTHTENMEKYFPPTMVDKESVPPMLKSSAKTAVNILSNDISIISGQKSMEAFLNLSQSKGIDSFINLGEPEFNDLLMNVTEPSTLYRSIISPINDSTFVENATQNDVKEESDFKSMNETFVMQSADNTITLDNGYCTNTLNKILKQSVELDKELNETYDTEAIETLTQSNYNQEEIALSSTFITEHNRADATFVQVSNEVNNIEPLDTTYLSSVKNADKNESDIYKPTVQQADFNVTCDIPSTESATNILDISFKVPNQSTPMNPNMLNQISKFAAKHFEQPRQAMYSTLKAPTSLRRELLAEIQRSGERKWDSTYNHIPSDHLDSRKENIRKLSNEDETDILPLNRYQTYKKSVLTNQCRSQKEIAQKELSTDQRKFYTFTKKSNNNFVEKTDAIASECAKIRNPDTDDTFCKPLPPKAQQKQTVPRMLSKLPKFLQKSNPNLVSNSLKAASGASTGYASISSVGYIKGSQPNIVQRDTTERSQLPNKLYSYGLQQDSAPHIRVLENTWVEAKTDLPSPILKNGIEYDEIDKHSQNIDLRMKCSSPFNPTGSSHALNNDENPEDNLTKTKDEVAIVEKTKDQIVPKIENKTCRLRQPINWNAGSKPAAVISGIPRPASRIPALRFIRPNAKTAQTDLRKEYT